MIDKEEFYRGAALALLLENPKCKTISRFDKGSYIAHDTFLHVRYTTKSRSPWGFSISSNDIERFNSSSVSVKKSLLVLVCGGDGICVLNMDEFNKLLGLNPGWISIRRKHNSQYEVKGSLDQLTNKIPRNRWPEIVFNGESE